MTALTSRPSDRKSEAAGGTGPVGAVLVVARGPDVGRRWSLGTDGQVVLGRDPGCDVLLSHLSVSRRHAEIRGVGDGWELRDLGSLVGSYLNGVPVDTAVLRDGDEIVLGVFRLVVSVPG
jgi:pSer/pThr/pTyr-binding forkhead associated (FHA) protein